jgi:Tol biopolymer transport system component
MRRIAAALAGIAVLAVACTGGSVPEGPAGPAPSVDILPGVARGIRLLVLTDDGEVLTTARDGGSAIVLRPGGGLDVEARQPVWSPDGRTVAWVEVGTGGPPASSLLVTSRPDGSGRREVQVDTGMFFLQWDPTSSRVAYLGSYRDAVGMGVAEPGAEGGPIARTLGVGEPFYVSWSPEGDRLLIHVGAETLGRIDLEGELTPVGDRPGVFHAPVWLGDGRLIYAVSDGERQVLVVRNGDRTSELVRFRGAIEFVVSPDGERIAYRVDAGGGLGTVSVVGIDSGRSERVGDLPVSAFHWSPDGRRLLLMSPEEGDDPTTHRWHVWDGRDEEPIGPAFLPSPTYLRDYVPFFGQYAQAMTLWSPDGRSFAFPGLIGDRAGIWVQDLDADEPTFVVEDGSVVAWSPIAL